MLYLNWLNDCPPLSTNKCIGPGPKGLFCRELLLTVSRKNIIIRKIVTIFCFNATPFFSFCYPCFIICNASMPQFVYTIRSSEQRDQQDVGCASNSSFHRNCPLRSCTALQLTYTRCTGLNNMVY